LEGAAQLVHMTPGKIRNYVQRGLVRPIRGQGPHVFFDETELARLRKMRRLTEDLGLNDAGVEIVLRLLDEIEALRGRASSGDAGPTERARWRSMPWR
jgi:MerR family transcriptional regulator/heat shock protein HspR